MILSHPRSTDRAPAARYASHPRAATAAVHPNGMEA